jgi:glutamate N-acetyltransferase/amino-acid N-acetyltransferase
MNIEENMCQGFKYAGVASGLKKNGQKDLGLIYSETPAKVAGVFTRNEVKAAPVILDMQRIVSGTCQAVIANSGNANCCTGEKGMQDAILMAQWTANELDLPEEQVLVASTGVIGESLSIEKIQKVLPDLVAVLDSDRISDFAEAIMTTRCQGGRNDPPGYGHAALLCDDRCSLPVRYTPRDAVEVNRTHLKPHHGRRRYQHQ